MIIKLERIIYVLYLRRLQQKKLKNCRQAQKKCNIYHINSLKIQAIIQNKNLKRSNSKNLNSSNPYRIANNVLNKEQKSQREIQGASSSLVNVEKTLSYANLDLVSSWSLKICLQISQNHTLFLQSLRSKQLKKLVRRSNYKNSCAKKLNSN